MAAENAIAKTDPRSIEVSRPTTARRGAWTYRPNVDIFDTPDEVLLVADLPGADAQGIDVSMESGVLTVQADVPARTAGASARSIAQEYGVGGFHRRFRLDESIESSAISAEYRDGTLTVHLPKSAQARRHRIPVTG